MGKVDRISEKAGKNWEGSLDKLVEVVGSDGDDRVLPLKSKIFIKCQRESCFELT